MKIAHIKQRRDGKFLVTLTFSRDLKNLHKVMTKEQIDNLAAKLAAEQLEQA